MSGWATPTASTSSCTQRCDSRSCSTMAMRTGAASARSSSPDCSRISRGGSGPGGVSGACGGSSCAELSTVFTTAVYLNLNHAPACPETQCSSPAANRAHLLRVVADCASGGRGVAVAATARPGPPVRTGQPIDGRCICCARSIRQQGCCTEAQKHLQVPGIRALPACLAWRSLPVRSRPRIYH
ncbi:Uncharacterised protein [Mycobacteroides abscessus subsp. abscessus]|nr:Uncharacterised protein [Mycobacteroides abscessus subsp. abscessus]